MQHLYQSFVIKIIFTRANSLENAISNVVEVISPALAGFLISIIGIKYVFAFDSLTYFLAAYLIWRFVRVRRDIYTKVQNVGSSFKNYWNSIKSGFIFSAKNETVRFFLLLEFLISLVGGMINIYLMYFVLDVLKGSVREFGIMSSISALSTIVGSLIVGNIAENLSKPTMYSVSILFLGITFSFFYFIDHVYLMYPVFFVIGFLNSILQISFMSGIQKRIDERYHGRIFSLYTSLNTLSSSFSFIIGGIISEKIGLRSMYLFSGLALVIIAILGFSYKKEIKIT